MSKLGVELYPRQTGDIELASDEGTSDQMC